MRFLSIGVALMLFAFAGCAAIQKSIEASKSRPRGKNVWAAVQGPSLNVDGSHSLYFSEFIGYLSRLGSNQFDGIRNYPLPMTRVEVDVSFAPNRQMTILGVRGSVSPEIANAAEAIVREAYANMPFTAEAYADFSRTTKIIFIFG